MPGELGAAWPVLVPDAVPTSLPVPVRGAVAVAAVAALLLVADCAVVVLGALTGLDGGEGTTTTAGGKAVADGVGRAVVASGNSR